MTRTWWDEDEGDDQADAVVWAIVFFTIGGLIYMYRPANHTGWFLIAGGISFLAGITFLFLAMFRTYR